MYLHALIKKINYIQTFNIIVLHNYYIFYGLFIYLFFLNKLK